MADGKQLWGSKCRRILQVEVKKKLQATLGNVDSQARLDIAKQIAMTIAELEEDRVSEEQVAAANYDKLTGYIAVFIEQAKDVQQAWKVVEDIAAASAPEVREESTTSRSEKSTAKTARRATTSGEGIGCRKVVGPASAGGKREGLQHQQRRHLHK